MIYNIRVAGVTAENRQNILDSLRGFPINHQLKFRLQQEPENPYDKNAIAVYSEDLNEKVGFVPKNETKIFNEKLNAGVKFNITGIVVGDRDYGFNLGLTLKCVVENDNDDVEIIGV